MSKKPKDVDGDAAKWEYLGQCLETTPLVGVYRSKARDTYEPTLNAEPDVFLFHGADNRDQKETRFSWVEEDIGYLSEEHDLSHKPFVVFRDEYEDLQDGFDDLEDKYGLNIVVDDSEPYPGAKDWLPLAETDLQNVRSYTSRPNRDKLAAVAKDLMPEKEFTVFGIEDGSDSDLRFYLGKLDYVLRQKRSVSEHIQE